MADHVFTLTLAKGDKAGDPYHVKVSNPGIFWKDVKVGDTVTFKPKPGDKVSTPDGTEATIEKIEVEFKSHDGLFPFEVHTVLSGGPHKVASATRAWTAMCYLTINGVRHGYEGDGSGACTHCPP